MTWLVNPILVVAVNSGRQSENSNLRPASFRKPQTENLKPKTSGEAETIGTTSNHPFWAEDRQEFLQAGSLEIGERLQTLSGDVKVVQQKLPRPGPQPVFNLEVHDEHVYFVGEDGVLVHTTKSYTSAELLGNEVHGYAYQLKHGKKIVYHGIAEGATPELARSNLLSRLSEHSGSKTFDTMEVLVAQKLYHGQLRTFESQSIRIVLDAGGIIESQ